MRALYRRLLEDSPLTERFIDVDGKAVHMLEGGDGPPLLLIHGTGNEAGFFLPLLRRLTAVRAIAIDRPGYGLSDPIDLPRSVCREKAITWLERLMDSLGIRTVTLAGSSMGGIWSLWFALAHAHRVDRVILLGGSPLLPHTRSPFPFRLIATPGLGELIQMLPTTEASVLQFSRFMGEAEAVAADPDIMDFLIAEGRDPIGSKVMKEESRVILSPLALVSRDGWRREMMIRREDLEDLRAPLLVIWGQREPLGGVDVAKTLATMTGDGRHQIVTGGHAPWLGSPGEVARHVEEFVVT